MWLLDVNVPQQTVPILNEFGIVARHAVSYGWAELTNGELVEAASAVGFPCIVTRDKQFAESASRAPRRFPGFAVGGPNSSGTGSFDTVAYSRLVISSITEVL